MKIFRIFLTFVMLSFQVYTVSCGTDKKQNPPESFTYSNNQLFEAAKNGDLEYIKQALYDNSINAGDIDSDQIKNEFGDTFFHVAYKNGQMSIIHYFLEGKSYRTNRIARFKDDRGNSVLILAIQKGDVATVASYKNIYNGGDHNHNNLGQSPLHVAVQEGNLEIVKMLGEDVPRDVLTADNNGDIPLHVAFAHSSDEIIKQLLVMGEFSSVNKVDLKGRTPLMLAIEHNKREVVEVLLADRSIDVNLLDENKQSALHKAVIYNNPSVIELLLDVEDIDKSIIDDEGNTPIHVASAMGHLDSLNIILNDQSYLINTYNSKEQTALHVAILSNEIEIADALLRNKRYRRDFKDGNGHSAFYLAAEQGKDKLLKRMMEIEKSIIDDQEVDIQKDFLKALSRKDKVAYTAFIKSGLLKERFDNERNDTLLHVAARQADFETIKLILMKYKIDVNAKNKLGETPLHVAAREANYQVVTSLLTNKKVLPNAVDNDGFTALHFAIISSVKISKVTCGSSDQSNNKQNQSTYIEEFKKCKHPSVLTLLALVNSNSVDVNKKSFGGAAPIHYIVNGSRSEDTLNLFLLQALMTSDKLDFNIGHDFRNNFSAFEISVLNNDERLVLFMLNNEKFQIRNIFASYQSASDDLKKIIYSNYSYYKYRTIINQTKEFVTLLQFNEIQEVVRALNRWQLDVNMRYSLTTPEYILHKAIDYGYTELVLELLKVDGIDIEIEDYRGLTPLELAQQNNNNLIIEALQNHKNN